MACSTAIGSGSNATSAPSSLRAAAWVRYPAMALKFALAFALAGLSCNFFEKRFLALKGRFEPEYRKAAPPPGVAIG